MPAVQEQIGPHAMHALLRDRKRSLNRFYKADDGEAVTIDVPAVNTTIDEKRMMVGPVFISTPAQDRVGDILLPEGARLETYSTNPVVYWDHGFSGEDGGTMPIATSEDPEGNLTVALDEEGVKAWAYFHGQTPLSIQVFRLVAAKAIRAASVRPVAIDSEILVDDESGELSVLMKAWDLIEWSFCGIGVNQEALFKAVRDQRLDGEKLARPLMKSFKSLVPKIVQGIGMPKSLKKKSVTKTDDEELKGMDTEDEDEFKSDDEDELKSMDDDDESPVEREKADDEDERDKSDDEELDDKAENEEDVEEETHMKYGAQVLSALNASIKELIKGAEPSLGPLENENVRKATEELVDELKGKLAAIEGLYADQYPDMPGLNGDEDKSEAEEDEEALKSFLRTGLLVRTQFAGYANRLKGLVGAKNLNPQQRLMLKETLAGMSRMEKQAREQTKSALEQKFDMLADRYAALNKKLGQLAPHERSA